jgi:hypothetical protein
VRSLFGAIIELPSKPLARTLRTIWRPSIGRVGRKLVSFRLSFYKKRNSSHYLSKESQCRYVVGLKIMYKFLHSQALIIASLLMLITGCTDKALTADVALLKQEVASLKANPKMAEELRSIRTDISKVKEELGSISVSLKDSLESSKQRELRGAQVEKGLLERIAALDLHLSGTEVRMRSLTDRLDGLINLLPIEKLSMWKTSGEVACQQLTIKDVNSSNITTATPNYITQQDASGAFLRLGSIGQTRGLIAKSKTGYNSGLFVGDKEAELVVVGPDESYSKINATPLGGGFLSAKKDQEKQVVGLFRLEEKNETYLMMSNPKNTFLANAGGVELKKGDQLVLKLQSASRGANMAIYDDVGSRPKILLNLVENGEPNITVIGATQFDVMYPKVDHPK